MLNPLRNARARAPGHASIRSGLRAEAGHDKRDAIHDNELEWNRKKPLILSLPAVESQTETPQPATPVGRESLALFCARLPPPFFFVGRKFLCGAARNRGEGKKPGPANAPIKGDRLGPRQEGLRHFSLTARPPSAYPSSIFSPFYNFFTPAPGPLL